jgi:hypothetical protein
MLLFHQLISNLDDVEASLLKVNNFKPQNITFEQNLPMEVLTVN